MESVLCDLCKWSEKSATNSRNSSHILLFIPCECVKWSERREKNRTIHWLFHTKWGTSIVHLLSPENWETTKPLYLCRTNLIGTQWKMLTCNVNDVSITIWLRAWQKQKQRTRCRIIMAIIIITRLTRAHTACVCVWSPVAGSSYWMRTVQCAWCRRMYAFIKFNSVKLSYYHFIYF